MENPKYFDMWVECQGREIDARVEFDYSPAEPDVNAGESLAVTAAYRVNPSLTGPLYDDLLAKMDQEECADLVDRVLEKVRGRDADNYDREADYYRDMIEDLRCEELNLRAAQRRMGA